MAFDLPDGGADVLGAAMPVVVRSAFGVLMVDSDGIPFKNIRLLDDPAVSGTPGLDLVEVIRPADEPEIGICEKGVFLWGEHHCLPLPFVHLEQ